ncbi:MAG: MobV family relaxase, partial [Christensenellaceae bacterium]
MPYAILRFEKRKGGPATALEKHHERKKEQYQSNPDIDKARSHLNYHLVEPQLKYYGEIQTRIEKAQKENSKCKVRKDSVKFIDTIVTASPEFLAELSEEKTKQYFEHALNFLKAEVGEDNIFSAVVHMDEKNPHMHLCFVPLTKDKRLSAKEVIGDRNKLIEWQDKFHDHMAAEFPVLQRGESAAITKRKHVPTWFYKQANRLTEQMQTMKKEIESIGTFNAQKKKETLQELFSKWYPQINAFENQLRPYDNRIKDLEHDHVVMKHDYDRKDLQASRANDEAANLRSQLWEYQDFMESIPDELREELLRKYQQGHGEQEQV